MENKFRASYTILSQWASGQWEKAIKTYFKLEDFVTPAMVEGRKYHEEWADYIGKKLKLPAEFGGKELNNPKCERKIVVSLTPWLDLVGKIDCYDTPVIYEFKTGLQSSENYASSFQAGVYGVLATYSGLYINLAEIHHFNQYSKTHDLSLVWLTDKLLKEAFNWIETLSSEMHDYFVKNGLYEKFEARVRGVPRYDNYDYDV